MRVGSMFTGYGGLDMAVLAFYGGSLAWYAEVEPAACKVLAAHHPEVLNLGDVRRIDWTQVEPVDAITAGYPCQPFSHAGKRKGKNDERHLWPYVRDAIGALGPRHVVLENVAGHLSMGLADVIGDLAGLGYDARWGVVRASDAGAPHRRARVFIVANPEERGRGEGPGSAAAQAGRGFAGTGDDSGFSADPGGRSFARTGAARVGLSEPAERRAEPAADAGSQRPSRSQPIAELEGRRPCVESQDAVADADGSGSEARVDAGHDSQWVRVESMGLALPTTDASGSGLIDWGQYEPVIRRWERLTRAAPAPTIAGANGKQRLSPSFVEWMMGLPEGHVTGHGLSSAQALKMLGNGVVPQQARLALGMLA